MRKFKSIIIINMLIILSISTTGCGVRDRIRDKVLNKNSESLLLTGNDNGTGELDFTEFRPAANGNYVLPNTVKIRKESSLTDIITNLIKNCPEYLDADLKVLDCTNKSGIVTINFSKEFLDADINKNGLRIYTIVNTLGYNDIQAKAVGFLVNGENMSYNGKQLDCTLYQPSSYMLDPSIGLGDSLKAKNESDKDSTKDVESSTDTTKNTN